MVNSKTDKEAVATVEDPEHSRSKLKYLGGSNSDTFNNTLANQVVHTLWFKTTDEAGKTKLMTAALTALAGIKPRDEIEGMLAAQMVAAHSASMEAFRRAMIPDQTFEGRRMALDQANKLTRSFTGLLEALNRHRGKGQQKVTVEHVHVHAGGQAIVGAVEAGGRAPLENERQPHAQAVSHAPVAPLRSENEERQLVPISGDAERAVPHARGPITRRTQG